MAFDETTGEYVLDDGPELEELRRLYAKGRKPDSIALAVEASGQPTDELEVVKAHN